MEQKHEKQNHRLQSNYLIFADDNDVENELSLDTLLSKVFDDSVDHGYDVSEESRTTSESAASIALDGLDLRFDAFGYSSAPTPRVTANKRFLQMQDAQEDERDRSANR